MQELRTAFITGASSGIGAALARRLGARGVRVGLAARRAAELEALAEEIMKAGGQAEVFVLDVADADRVGETMRAADDALGGIDLVVANAGIGTGRWGGKLAWKDIAPTLQVNVLGAAATLTALLPRMLERGRGHLVGVSSLAAYRGLPKQAAYSASKAFLSTFLESLRIDLQRTPVAVTDIRPGYVHTEMTSRNKSMPFVMDADTAARQIERAIAARKAVHAFPLTMATMTRSMTALPARLYDPLASRFL